MGSPATATHLVHHRKLRRADLAALLERVEALVGENARLAARVAELEARLGLPPKTPDSSSLPPSKGHKPSLPSVPKRKAKAHPGAHRLLHPEPLRDVALG